MKKFQILPNDPRLLSLFQEQIDFILLSMERDVQEEKAAISGKDLSAAVVDNNYSKIDKAERDEDWDIMENGQDPNEIYQQVKELTEAVNPEFEKSNSEKLKVEQSKVNDRLRNKQDIIKEQQQIIADAKKRAAKMKANRQPSKVITNDDTEINDSEFLN